MVRLQLGEPEQRAEARQLGRVCERAPDLPLDVRERGRGCGKLPIHEEATTRECAALYTRPKRRADDSENTGINSGAALVFWFSMVYTRVEIRVVPYLFLG